MTRSFGSSSPVLLAAAFLIPLWLLPAAPDPEPTPNPALPIPTPEIPASPQADFPPSSEPGLDSSAPLAAPLLQTDPTQALTLLEPSFLFRTEPTLETPAPDVSPETLMPEPTPPSPEGLPGAAPASDDTGHFPPADGPSDPASTPSPDPDVPAAPLILDLAASGSSSPQALPSETPAPQDSTTSATPSETSTPGVVFTPTGTPSATQTPIPSGTPTPTLSPTASMTPTESLTPTPSATASPTPSPTLLLRAARGFSAGAVWINEIAWAGSLASSADEWIELFNPGTEPIDLSGWRLTDSGDIDRTLSGTLGPGEFYLLERTDDTTVADIPADLTYTGSLRNEGETLELLDPSGALVDRANAAGGAWPAGDRTTRASMQRLGREDVWDTYPGCGGNGIDASGGPIQGTPRQVNALDCVPPTPTETPTPTPAPVPTSAAEGALRINEIAWSGTHASSSDEWIELFNPGTIPIDLSGWRLTDGGDIDCTLTGTLGPGEFYLLERSDDQTVADIQADALYSGALSNDGERLELLDPTGASIDVANRRAGAWPAGDDQLHASMERKESGGWGTFSGYFGNGRDADGRRIAGTPRQPNSLLFPTPRPTWIPGQIVINEVLIRPHYDWEGKGGIDYGDEFIELYNHGPREVRLGGWILDDIRDGGSQPFVLPNRLIEADSYVVFFRSRTHLALNDTGDTVRLRAPDGHSIDTIRYLQVRAYNLSYGRLPDGSDHFAYGLWPTPGRANRAYTPPSFAPGCVLISEVAWAGTLASANDEWIELWNPGEDTISLEGWAVTDDNDIWAPLAGTLAPGGHFLLERTDDETVADRPAEGIYRGALSDDGERLRLIDPSGREIDVVNPDNGAWAAGDLASRGSMERFGDTWLTFSGDVEGGLDAAGWPIRGTPGTVNSRALETALSAVGICTPAAGTSGGACP